MNYTGIQPMLTSITTRRKRGYSFIVSSFLRRWRRFISPFAAVTKKPAVLSPVSFNCSISSITSWGILTVVICDFAFFAPVAITVLHSNRCISVYATKKTEKKT
ncbi:hypothetical protein CRG94_19475 [Escherichia sp. E3356]|nr:hypothetical protein CRG94_19475 [Escherichia sp. E3356]